MDKNLNNQLQNSIKKRRIYLGGSMVLDPCFDIKNYLTDVQKQVELEKITFNLKKSLPQLKINSYNSINYNYNVNKNIKDGDKKLIIKTYTDEKKPLTTINNLLSLSKDNIFNTHTSNEKKKYSIKTDLNIQKKILEANNSIQSTKNQIEKIIKKNKEGSKSTVSIFRNKKILSNEPRFNVVKTIKEIKKREKSFSQRNIIADNNKFFNKKYKTLEEQNDFYISKDNKYNKNKNVIAYNRNNEKAVFEPIKILNEYKRQKGLGLNFQENCLNNFYSQNKELTINSVLIKLMNLETNKLSRNYNLRNQSLKNDKKVIEKNEANFEDYKNSQKRACKQIDNIYVNVIKRNKELIDENRNCKSEIKSIQDEMRKELHQIDYLRVFGYFVNKVLGGDITRFENKIFPEQKYDDEVDIEKLTKTVIKKYKCFYENIEKEKFDQEKMFINDPEKMWFRFKEMEGIMVRNMYTKENVKGEIELILQENNINLKDLRQKYEILEEENKMLNEKYEYEFYKYHEIAKRYNYQKSEYDDLIKDFYIFINNIFNKNNIINNNKKTYNKLDVLDCIKKIHETICEKEIIIDKLLIDLKSWEKNDSKMIEDVANNRKKEIKHLKKINLKMRKRLKFENNVENSKNKFVFYSRKTEAPYQKPKKIVKEKVDEKLIEQQENEELLNYEEQ